jgi:hypothetical protein
MCPHPLFLVGPRESYSQYSASVDELHRELQALGGCDAARVAFGESVVQLVRPLPSAGDREVVTSDGPEDVRLTATGPSSSSHGRFQATKVLPACDPGDAAVWCEVTPSLLPWLSAGFSAVVVACCQVQWWRCCGVLRTELLAHAGG